MMDFSSDEMFDARLEARIEAQEEYEDQQERWFQDEDNSEPLGSLERKEREERDEDTSHPELDGETTTDQDQQALEDECDHQYAEVETAPLGVRCIKCGHFIGAWE
jgi:hypothetical protein